MTKRDTLSLARYWEQRARKTDEPAKKEAFSQRARQLKKEAGTE